MSLRLFIYELFVVWILFEIWICWKGSQSYRELQCEVDLTQIGRDFTGQKVKQVACNRKTSCLFTRKHWIWKVNEQSVTVLKVVHGDNGEVVISHSSILFTWSFVSKQSRFRSPRHRHVRPIILLPGVIRLIKFVQNCDVPRPRCL